MSIIYNVQDSEKYIYHYTSAEKAIQFILKDRTLLLNSISATNDPKESKEWTLSLSTNQDPTPPDFHANSLSKNVSRRLRESAFLACFCTDKSGLSGDHSRDILLRGLSKPRMWAQYADLHRGFCLVFDKEILLQKVKKQFEVVFFGEVTYKNRSWMTRLEPGPFMIDYDLLQRIGIDDYCRLHTLQYIQELYFEKLEDWKDESEWRLVVMEELKSHHFIYFEESLVGIVHGANTPEADSRKVIDLASESTIEHTGLRWFNHCPWYDLGNPIWLLRQ